MCGARNHCAKSINDRLLKEGIKVLPTAVNPSHYDVRIRPNFEALHSVDKTFPFSGEVDITIDVSESVKQIRCHSAKLVVHSASVGSAKAESIEYNTEDEELILTFKENIPVGEANLSITYDGTINNFMCGFYRSVYNDPKTGEEKWLASTQFENTDARQAFPCWDEPAHKATFKVTMHAPKDLTVLSNMPVEATQPSDQADYTATTFMTSPKMSSYLLAWVIGDLSYVETYTKGEFMDRIPVKSYAVKGWEHQAKFSVELAAKILEFYSKEFGVAYPLPKLDQVAVPQFAMGAMENWGLVTYRVSDLLMDDANTSAAQRQRVSEDQAEALQFVPPQVEVFGNLVTMEWWSGLWLNEGFATWMSWYALNSFHPEWKIWQGFVGDELQAAFALDGLRSSHPIEMPMNSSKEVEEAFDIISYEKGASSIRMISNFLGEDVFIQGIRKYIKRHVYGSTRTEDLWKALSEASGKDVTAFADIWTKKIGYPIVTVKETGGKIQLEQHRFLLTNDVKAIDDETLYPINLALKVDNEGSEPSIRNILFTERSMDLSVEPNQLIKLNTNHAGFYRTAYTASRLLNLADLAVAQPHKISVEDKIGLIADANALAVGGTYNSADVLQIGEKWKRDTSYFVWDQILAFANSVRFVFGNVSPTLDDLSKQHLRELAGVVVHEIGWRFELNEESSSQKLKALVFSVAGINGDKIIYNAANKMFEEYQSGNKAALNSNLRHTVFVLVAKHGGEQGWTAIQNIYLNTQNEEKERESAISALSKSLDPELRRKTYQFALSPQVRIQDIDKCLGRPSTRIQAQELFKFFAENYEAFGARIGTTSGATMRGAVSAVTGSFTSLDDIREIQDFFQGKDLQGFALALEQSYDRIRLRSAWLERDTTSVDKWLSEKYSESRVA